MSTFLTVTAHGRFSIRDATGRDLTPRGQKARALFAMLTLSPDGSRTRDWLRECLWSDRSEEQGATSLRQSLSELRRALGENAEMLTSDRSVVALDLRMIELAGIDGPLLEDVKVRDPVYLAWHDQTSKELGTGASVQDRSSIPGSAIPDGPFAPPLALHGPAIAPSFDPHAMRRRNELPTVAVASLFSAPHVEDAEHVAIVQSAIKRIGAHIGSWGNFSVISPGMVENTLKRFGNGNEGLHQLRRSLSCEYVVDVTVLPRGNGHDVHVDLFDADTTLRWSGNFSCLDGELEEQIVQIIAGNVGTMIDGAEQKAAMKSPDGTNVRNLTYRGRHHLLRMNRYDTDVAMKLFETAARIEPERLPLRINVAYAIFARAWASRGPKQALKDARERARVITTIDETFPEAFYLLGNCESLLRRRQEARTSVLQSLRLAPSAPLAQAQHGSNLIAEGQFPEAVDALEKALRLGESDRRRFFIFGEMAMALHLAERHEEAVEAAERAVGLRSSYWYAHMILCAAHDRAGNTEAARRSGRKMFETRRGLKREDIEWLPFEDRSINDALWSRCERYRP